MAQEPERPKSAKEDVGEVTQEKLPPLTEVITDYEELSPFYQRSFSAPAAGVDQQRQPASATGKLKPHPSTLRSQVAVRKSLPPGGGALFSHRPPYRPRRPKHQRSTLTPAPPLSTYLPQQSTVPTRPPPPPPPHAPYQSRAYPTGQRRSSYSEEPRQGRHELRLYPPDLPIATSSYPPSYSYEYSGAGTGYYNPYGGYEYHASRRLSQESAFHLDVPERWLQPPIHGPTSPSTIHAQPLRILSVTRGSAKRRENLSKESKNILRRWLETHPEHPYPTREEKKELANKARITMAPLDSWFSNARRASKTQKKNSGGSGSPPTSRTPRRQPDDS